MAVLGPNNSIEWRLVRASQNDKFPSQELDNSAQCLQEMPQHLEKYPKNLQKYHKNPLVRMNWPMTQFPEPQVIWLFVKKKKKLWKLRQYFRVSNSCYAMMSFPNIVTYRALIYFSGSFFWIITMSMKILIRYLYVICSIMTTDAMFCLMGHPKESRSSNKYQ